MASGGPRMASVMSSAIEQPPVRPASATEHEQWAAVRQRDPEADGTFYYSVLTTAVYCRPSCVARLARREHVQFYRTWVDAERAGFRPCKRCRPNEALLAVRHASAVARACRLIDEAEEMPALRRAGGWRGHELTSLSPSLQEGDWIDAQGLCLRISGSFRHVRWNSSHARKRERRWRDSCEEFHLTSVCAISLGDDPDRLARDLQDRFPNARLIGGDEVFEQWVAQVVGVVEVPNVRLDLPLDVQGTAFQRRVWRALREIPLGSTASYALVAQRTGAPNAARAVARACAGQRAGRGHSVSPSRPYRRHAF